MRRTISTFAAGILVGGGLFASSGLMAQEHGQMSQEEMMKMCEQAAQPGPQHAELAKMAGKWNQVSKCWMEPSSTPEVSESIAECKTVLGGRFVVQSIKGDMAMGGETMPFEGLGIYGYDNLKKQPFFIWLDSMGTGYMVGEGTEDSSGAITYMSECTTPMGPMKFKSVSHPIKDDTNVFEMYAQDPQGNWYKHLQIDATRARSYGGH